MAHLSKFFRIRLFFSKFSPQQCKRHFIHSVKSEFLYRIGAETNEERVTLVEKFEFLILKSDDSKLVVLEIHVPDQVLFGIACSVIPHISRITTWESFYCASEEVSYYFFFFYFYRALFPLVLIVPFTFFLGIRSLQFTSFENVTMSFQPAQLNDRQIRYLKRIEVRIFRRKCSVQFTAALNFLFAELQAGLNRHFGDQHVDLRNAPVLYQSFGEWSRFVQFRICTLDSRLFKIFCHLVPMLPRNKFYQFRILRNN